MEIIKRNLVKMKKSWRNKTIRQVKLFLNAYEKQVELIMEFVLHTQKFSFSLTAKNENIIVIIGRIFLFVLLSSMIKFLQTQWTIWGASFVRDQNNWRCQVGRHFEIYYDLS